MKREGRPHGSVRTTTSGIDGLARALQSPTAGHCKHTGKCKKARCGQCHTHPVSESRDKAKGAYKLKCSDVVLNHRLVSWRVAAADRSAGAAVQLSGASASGVLDALLTDSCWSQGDDDVRNEEDDHYGYEDGFVEEFFAIGEDVDEEEEISSIHGNEEGEGEEEEDMGFYEVGFVWEYVDEEDWCVVSEM